MLTDVADGVATLTLNKPDERNSLSAPMVDEIVAAMDAFEADEAVGAVVVTGAPPAFCAGANLGNLAEADGDSLGSIYEGFLRVARSPLPTIAAVNGAAVGAGMNLALGCDVRIAARRAKFDTRFMQLGLHPGGGHTWMLRQIAGPQVAMAAVLFGDVLDGAGGGPHRARVPVCRRRRAASRRPSDGGPGGERPTGTDHHDEADDRRHGDGHQPPRRRRRRARPAALVDSAIVVRRTSGRPAVPHQ